MLIKEKYRGEIDNIKDELRDILDHPSIDIMKKCIQHGDTTTYEHCLRVVFASYIMNKKLRLNSNEKALIIGAFLHDFYLYDWHDEEQRPEGLHGFRHPLVAANNARDIFSVDNEVYNMIVSHMWPLTITKVPRSREAIIITLADKYCSLLETLIRRHNYEIVRKGYFNTKIVGL